MERRFSNFVKASAKSSASFLKCEPACMSVRYMCMCAYVGSVRTYVCTVAWWRVGLDVITTNKTEPLKHVKTFR